MSLDPQPFFFPKQQASQKKVSLIRSNMSRESQFKLKIKQCNLRISSKQLKSMRFFNLVWIIPVTKKSQLCTLRKKDQIAYTHFKLFNLIYLIAQNGRITCYKILHVPHITQCTVCNENFLPPKQLWQYWWPDQKAPWVITLHT